MKLIFQKISFVIAGAALVLAGCAKKPERPTPVSTLMGPQSGGGAIIPSDLPAATDPGTMLTPRPDDFDANGQLRGKLEAVYFDFDSSDIKAPERVKLQAAKDYLDKNPTQRLVLEGHCDWRGTAEYNLSLGDRRATGAKNYLIKLGVPADKLEANSKGSLDAAKNADDATMAKDRRAELVIVKAK